jgi:hypothetical protein
MESGSAIEMAKGTGMERFLRSMTAGLVGGVFLFAAAASHAELQRVEAVGIYGIRDAMRSKVIPRDEAIAKARWEGVSRVALELIRELAPIESAEIGEGDPVDTAPVGPDDANATEPSEDDAEALRAALGKDVLPYTRSYRILDDRGEVPVLFNDEPDVAVEYVVVVEVIVDVDRLTSALGNAGLIAVAATSTSGEAVVVELVGLARYEAFAIVRDSLKKQFGATRVRTVEFSREKQILEVEGSLDAPTLLARLGRFEHPQLVLEPLGIDPLGGRIRLMGRWFGETDADPAPTS